MELSMEIATAEQIKEQQALRLDNAINVTVSEALQNQLMNLKTYFIEILQDEAATSPDGSSLLDSMLAQEDSATEPVCVDVAAQMFFLEDLQSLVNQVQLTEASQSCVNNLQQIGQFFSEDFLTQCRDLLAKQVNDLGPGQDDLRLQLANQEEIFSAERQKLEREVVQAFAPNNEQSLQDVITRTNTLRDDLSSLQQQWSDCPDGAEKYELLQQAASVAASFEHYERLAWVVDTALLNQQCTDNLSLLNELRPALPVVMDADGLPLQQFGATQIGDCYRTEEQAWAAAEAEYQQRLENANTEKQREEVKHPHVLHVEILDRQPNVVADWWEISESGQREREGHTEQKMANRIDFSVMAEEGYSLQLRGSNPPCDGNYGCDMMLEYFAQKYDVPIVYTDFDDDRHVYQRDKQFEE